VTQSDEPNKFGVVGTVYTILKAGGDNNITIMDGIPAAASYSFELVIKEEPDMTSEDEIATLEARLDELNKKRAETRQTLAQTTLDLDSLAAAIDMGRSPKAKTIETLRSLATRLTVLRGDV
jgi:septal ring factor EnvC (AmiA/AmiB activator)